jgi:GDP-4-dehydro-6-deoxy-D-mannose reductase
MDERTTLVTGAAGFVGQHLLGRLRGRRLLGWHRPGRPTPASPPGVAWRAVDLLDRDTVESALGIDAPDEVYHLAGAPQVDTSWQNVVPHLRTNALGTYYLLEAIRRANLGCRTLVVTSAQVYQPGDDPLDENAPLVPPNPYGLSKLAQDQLALRAADEDGLDVVVARPFNHTGPGQKAAYAVPGFARQIARIEAGLEEPTIAVGNLDTRRDITDVRDVVDAYLLMMTSAPAGRPYNVCSGRAWRIGDLLEELLHLAHRPIAVAVDESRLRPNDIPVVQGDATRIRSELGWSPHISVEQTLRDTLDWWRKQH